MFTPEQEVELGDVISEHIEHQFHIIDDSELTAHLNELAQRIVAQLPPTGLHFQVYLYDDAVPNAFSIAGGRIYVSRKLVAFVKDEDELAGLLGHEMGHILSHQEAAEQSALFEKILGVTHVTTRQDIQDKYNQMLDNLAKKPEVLRQIESKEEPNQYVADRISLFAVSNAGFSPEALLQFWDRFAQTHGKAGNAFSDLFGLSTQSEKRLEEMRKSLATLPPACLRKESATADSDFLAWQAAVIAYSGLGRKENVAGLISKKTLDPPLRSDLKNLRFSPNGKYILAQDDASVFVLTHDPFQQVFRFDAADADSALFTPDSNDVVFLTKNLRVEDWNIATQSRASAHEIVNEGGCLQSGLSPDGKRVACLSSDTDLVIYDAESGNAIFTRKKFWTMSFEDMVLTLMARVNHERPEFIHMAFSPDARSLVASHGLENIAVDLTTGQEIHMHSALHEDRWGAVAFLTPDTLIIENASEPLKSVVAKFPSGQTAQKIALGTRHLRASPQGDYVYLSPIRDGEVGVLDVKTQKFLVALKKSPAIDAYGTEFVGEGNTGQVGLFTLADLKVQKKADLTLGPMGALRATSVSDDFRWLAVSGDSRGAVWNLDAMNRLYFIRGFRGAFFDGDSTLYADFPKHNDTDRTIARADLRQVAIQKGVMIDEETVAYQHGRYLVTRKVPEYATSFSMEVKDVSSGGVLWSRAFPKEVPESTENPVSNRMILSWALSSPGAKDEIKNNPGLHTRYGAMKDRKGAYLIEVLELSTGKLIGAVLVDTGNGSFEVEHANAVGDWLFVTDGSGRTLIYSASSAQLKGTVFGGNSVASVEAGLLAVQPSASQLQFYSLPDLQKLGRASFASDFGLIRFSSDGSKLFILTKDQNAYVFEPKALSKTTAASAPSVAASQP